MYPHVSVRINMCSAGQSEKAVRRNMLCAVTPEPTCGKDEKRTPPSSHCRLTGEGTWQDTPDPDGKAIHAYSVVTNV